MWARPLNLCRQLPVLVRDWPWNSGRSVSARYLPFSLTLSQAGGNRGVEGQVIYQKTYIVVRLRVYTDQYRDMKINASTNSNNTSLFRAESLPSSQVISVVSKKSSSFLLSGSECLSSAPIPSFYTPNSEEVEQARPFPPYTNIHPRHIPIKIIFPPLTSETQTYCSAGLVTP